MYYDLLLYFYNSPPVSDARSGGRAYVHFENHGLLVKFKFNSNAFLFNIDTNSQNDYETRTKKGNAGLFVNKL